MCKYWGGREWEGEDQMLLKCAVLCPLCKEELWISKKKKGGGDCGD